MLAVFSLNYEAHDIYKKLSDEDKSAFKEAYGESQFTFDKLIGDPMLAMRLFKTVNLHRVITNEQNDRMDVILARLERLSLDFSRMKTFNEKCDVHVGGYALLQVNDTLLLEDACTDALQREIDAGWRILAVCVQPDGRRPDYILGRYNPGKDKK